MVTVTGSGLFLLGGPGGTPNDMEDTHREPRVAGTQQNEQSEEIRAQEAPAAIVARLLANPRRVRRN